MSLQKEQIEQINLVNWFNHNFPELEDDFHHFANERKCSLTQGRTLKRMGVKKGVADIFIALPENEYHGLWIELKSGKGKISKEQEEFLNRKTARGYCCAVCWGWEAAKVVILTYLGDYIQKREIFALKSSI